MTKFLGGAIAVCGAFLFCLALSAIFGQGRGLGGPVGVIFLGCVAWWSLSFGKKLFVGGAEAWVDLDGPESLWVVGTTVLVGLLGSTLSMLVLIVLGWDRFLRAPLVVFFVLLSSFPFIVFWYLCWKILKWRNHWRVSNRDGRER